MREIRFIWVCRNIHFNEIHRVELTDMMLLNRQYPSWIATDNCEVIAKILPTGLHDKNGKEIYEGDIVKFHDIAADMDFDVAPIVFNGCCFRADTLIGFRALHNRVMEVIGNKYENPELLEH